MNYDFHDVEGLALDAGTSATIACEFDGNKLSQPDGPHVLSGLTCSGSSAHPIGTAFIFDSFSSSTISNLNAESAATGYIIGNLAPLNGVSFNSLAGLIRLTTHIRLNSDASDEVGPLHLRILFQNCQQVYE